MGLEIKKGFPPPQKNNNLEQRSKGKNSGPQIMYRD